MAVADKVASMPLSLLSNAGSYLGVSNLNPSDWIDTLEKENISSDPHSKLRAFLDAYLEIFPKATYEEWVEEVLCKIEGWDEGSAVVDESFYTERSVHRNVWNERNALEGIDLDGVDIDEDNEDYLKEGDEDKSLDEAKKAGRKGRQYVPARNTSSFFSSSTTTTKRTSKEEVEEEEDTEIVFVTSESSDPITTEDAENNVVVGNDTKSSSVPKKVDDDLDDLVN
mmetsp:Transcript_32783/g.43554  ORF Transcript_32783/g.43554 Transcript_32783/m.43554 type:complete len:225 (-) Transcript_32783:22-696(-)